MAKPPKLESDTPALTREQAAEAVGLEPHLVLDFKLYEDKVVVVTVDGRKLVHPIGPNRDNLHE